MTRDQIQAILRGEYNQQRWLQVLREILPGTDVFASPQAVPVSVPDAPKAVQLARVRLGDRKQLAVLEVEVGERIDLLRNRVGLRNLVARFIDQAEYHGVLAVFLAPQKDFRFTFAARMAEFDDEGNLVRRETVPRRYTYVLGPNESCRTASERFLHLSEKGLSATMQDVIEAFSVEKLNKEFFADFSAAFESVKTEIQKRNRWDEKIAKEESQTLLNRLLFLYFVQRKGWLNRQRDYLFRNFSRFAGDTPAKVTFFDGFLRPLFTKLSTEGSQADIPGHDLPFLNGGLFADEYGDEQHDEAARRHHELQVSNGVFRSVFDDLLERYNFTIQEDSPTNYEVAIDPEMLGQIFEELILTSEDSETAGKSKRHDTGSHYTRRPIVHYLCRDSLAAWLESQPPFAGKNDAPDRVRKLLALDATEGIDDETRAALREILTPEEAAVVFDRSFDLRACDPAVGSGAFPMGLLHELVNLARLCATRAAGKDPVLGDRSWLYTTKKRIIERVIYGVDIQPQAVDICKLRLWLSLMVDYELSADPDDCEAVSFRRALKEIEPLPNLDFKIRRANSLVDYVHGESVELKKLSSETGASLTLSKLSAAKREFFNARTAAEKRKLRLAIYQNITELAKIELTRARMDAAGLGIALTDRDSERVAELDNALREIGFITAQLRDARKMRAQEQEDALERIRAQFDDPGKPTFVWQFDFAEVFHRDETSHGDSLLPGETSGRKNGGGARNGFDLLIGNPPYVRIQTLKRIAPRLVDYYKDRYRSAKFGNYDLYVVFVERGLELLHSDGQLAFIQPHKFFNADYGEPLRELLSGGKLLRHIVHFGDQQIFPGATNYVCLLFLGKSGSQAFRFMRADKLSIWLIAFSGTEEILPAAEVSGEDWNIVVGLARKPYLQLKALPKKLGHVAHIFQGLVTGADTIFAVDGAGPSKNGRVPIKDRNGKTWQLESNILRRFLHDIPIAPYVQPKPNRLLIFPYELRDRHAVLISTKRFSSEFPETWRYFKENEQELRGREGGKWQHDEWYAFGRSQNMTQMETPKLIVQVLAQSGRYALDCDDVYFTGGGNGPYYGLRWSRADENSSLLYLEAILDSRVHDFFIRQISTPFRGGYWSYGKRFIEKLPLPEASMEQQAVIVRIINLLAIIGASHSSQASGVGGNDDPLIVSYFEQWVNALVYELFFPQELHTAGLHFLDLIQAEVLPQLDKLAEPERLPHLRGFFQSAYSPNNKLRQALYRLGSLDLVRIIEGKA